MEGESLTTASGGNFIRDEANRGRADAAITQPQQSRLRVCLFVAEETSAYFPGNAYALLTPESRDSAIGTFSKNLRRVISLQMKKAGRNNPPD